MEGCYEVFDMLGEGRGQELLCTNSKVLRLDNVTDAPVIVAHRAG